MIDKEKSEKYSGLIEEKKRAGPPVQTFPTKVRHKVVRLVGLVKPKIEKAKMNPATKKLIIVVVILALAGALYYLIF